MASSKFPHLILHPGKERSLLLRHPWLFSGAINKIENNPAEGDLVEVYSHKGDYLGTGHYHDGSIKVRIVSFSQTDADDSFWLEKLQQANNLRLRLGLPAKNDTNIFRLVNAEGDGLPGLIIDIYGSTAVIQTHTVGMHRAKNSIVNGLKKIFGDNLKAIYDKSEETMVRNTGIEMQNEYLYGTMNDEPVFENGIMFTINWELGQKTGFFIDQRENRKLLGTYAPGKKVLNTFSYSGGFSLYALKSGAEVVHSVDSSKKAAEWAIENVRLNKVEDRHQFFTLDVFDHLKSSSEIYDVVVLDPPAFAKHKTTVEKAMIGYRNLNTEGIRKIAPGGILFTFSCSQVVDRILFRKIVFQAALQAKRTVQVLHQLSQGPDHPVSIFHPEGEYLKGLVLFVA